MLEGVTKTSVLHVLDPQFFSRTTRTTPDARARLLARRVLVLALLIRAAAFERRAPQTMAQRRGSGGAPRALEAVLWKKESRGPLGAKWARKLVVVESSGGAEENSPRGRRDARRPRRATKRGPTRRRQSIERSRGGRPCVDRRNVETPLLTQARPRPLPPREPEERPGAAKDLPPRVDDADAGRPRPEAGAARVRAQRRRDGLSARPRVRPGRQRAPRVLLRARAALRGRRAAAPESNVAV